MPITLVGDVDQLLYRFNGSKPEILGQEIVNYFPDIQTFKLETNYRSTQTIVEFQKKLIAHNYSGLGGPYSQDLFKDLKPREDAKVSDQITFNEYEDAQSEADATVNEIKILLANGAQNGNFFVLARTRAQLAFLEGPLTKRKIKFINLTGGSFWGSKHVQDVIAYLKLAHNNNNKTAFKRVFNIASKWFVHPFGKHKGEYCHHRYLGRAFLDKVNTDYNQIEYAGWRYQTGVEDLTILVEEIKQALHHGITSAIDYVVENCYTQYLAKEEGLTNIDESENGKLEDFEIVKEIAQDFENIDDFFAYVNEMVQQAEDAKKGNLNDFVVISTVHRIKGQERDTVFVIGVSEGQDIKSGQPAGLLPHTFSMAPPPQFGVLPTPGMGRIEDERCIVFVAISRAKSKVYLSSIQTYRKASLTPSRFISELKL